MLSSNISLNTPKSSFTKVMESNNILKEIFEESLEALNPKKLIRNAMKLHENTLNIDGKSSFDLNDHCCHIVGFGDSVFPMALEAEEILNNHLVDGVCLIPKGTLKKGDNKKKIKQSKIQFKETAKDDSLNKSISMARTVASFVDNLGTEDLLIVLIAGDNRSLAPLIRYPFSYSEYKQLLRRLKDNGATKEELCSLQGVVSILAGGGLARLAFPAYVITLVLSDVIGDPLQLIACGPTCPNTQNPNIFYTIFQKYKISSLYVIMFEEIVHGMQEEQQYRVYIPKDVLGNYRHVENYIIGNNKTVAKAAKTEAIKRGYDTLILSLTVSNNIPELSNLYKLLCFEIAMVINEFSDIFYLRKCLYSLRESLNFLDLVTFIKPRLTG